MTWKRLDVLLFVVAASSVAVATSTAAPRGTPTQPLLVLDHRIVARAGPNPQAAPLVAVAARAPLTGSRMVLPIVGGASGPLGGRWLRVRLPTRPNGATGWVPASAGRQAETPWRIVVHRSTRRAVVSQGGRVRARLSVVVGKPSTPTPLGSYFVVEKLYLGPHVTEGPWALATSAHSDVLHDFAGGDGQVGLHGTVGMGAPLGTFASHGCVRFGPWAISWLAARVGPGTPVIITR